MSSKKTEATTETKALTLHDVALESRAWADALEALEEGPDRELALQLAAKAALEGRAKVDRFAAFLDRLQFEATYARAEAEKFTNLARMFEAALEKLKAYAVDAMKAAAQPELEGDVRRLKLQSLGKPKVIVIDEAKIPAEYKSIELKMRASDWQQLVADAYPDLDDAKRSEIIGSLLKGTAKLEVMKTPLAAALAAGEVPGADLDLDAVFLKVK